MENALISVKRLRESKEREYTFPLKRIFKSPGDSDT